MSLDYTNTIHSLFSRRPHKRTNHKALLEELEKWGRPHLAYPTIHITGTNGKGQVGVKIARTLEHAGYKVGLFTSPHLLDFSERITINQRPIPHETVIQYDQELSRKTLNFFECSTLFGFRYFAEEEVDVAIIEVGLGGRLDSTNVVNPLLSIITSISIDHTDILGNTSNEIASEKAGIIKKNTPVVVGPRAKYLPIFEEAEKQNAPMHIIEKQSCFYDTENQAVAKEALQILSSHFTLSKESIEEGLRQSLPCRFEKRGNVIYDVAHNPDGFARLMSALGHLYPYQKFRFLIGMGKHKDCKQSLEKIVEKAVYVHFVQADNPASVSAEKLGKLFESLCPIPFSVEESVLTGMERAKAATKKGELLIVCGSFYIMADALKKSALSLEN